MSDLQKIKHSKMFVLQKRMIKKYIHQCENMEKNGSLSHIILKEKHQTRYKIDIDNRFRITRNLSKKIILNYL